MLSFLKISFALILYIVTLSFCAPSFAFNMKNSNQVYFLGDSLFDTGYMDNSQGFIPSGQDPIYTTPHGHVTPFYIDQKYNKINTSNNMSPPPNNSWVSGRKNGDNYAAGGAVSDGEGIGMTHYHPPALTYQVKQLLASHKITKNDMVFIWIGANDILKSYQANKSKGTQALAKAVLTAIDKATSTVATEVTTLHNAGVQHIIVLNLPPIGDTPFMNKNKDLQNLGNLASNMFNLALSSKLGALSFKPDIFDVHALFATITKDIDTNKKYTEPNTTLTLTNDTDPSCTDSSKNAMQLAINCKHWVPTDQQAHDLFADAIHPSDTAHQILAIHLEKFLNSTALK